MLLGAAFAEAPLVPINERLEDEDVRVLIALEADALMLTHNATSERLDGIDSTVLCSWRT